MFVLVSLSHSHTPPQFFFYLFFCVSRKVPQRRSGARTVVARLPVGGPSGTRRGPPRRSHSLFEARFATPTRPVSPSQWDLIFSHWDLRNSHWDLAKLPLGLPLGASAPPSGSFARSHWEREWDFQSAPRKASGSTEGAPRSSHWDPLGLWRGAIAESHSPARGAPRVLPLGGRATTVRAPLPLGYLPSLL